MDRIREGSLQAGDQIPPERTLAETLSVGRSSVREALQILSTLNVIRVAPGSGAFVKEPRASDVFRPELIGLLIGNSMVRELPQAREMIEPSAARLACLRGTHADISLIEDALENHELALISGQADQRACGGIPRARPQFLHIDSRDDLLMRLCCRIFRQQLSCCFGQCEGQSSVTEAVRHITDSHQQLST